MGKVKNEVIEYEEYLNWLQPSTVTEGTNALATKYNTLAGFVRPVVENWFEEQGINTNETDD